MKVSEDVYLRGLFWIIRERIGSGAGGWPPREIEKVVEWKVIHMLAHLTDRNVRDVAIDLIEQSQHIEGA